MNTELYKVRGARGEAPYPPGGALLSTVAPWEVTPSWAGSRCQGEGTRTIEEGLGETRNEWMQDDARCQRGGNREGTLWEWMREEQGSGSFIDDECRRRRRAGRID